MNGGIRFFLKIAVVSILFNPIRGSESATYSYFYGGSDWATHYPECGGSRQSPVNIFTPSISELGPVGNTWVLNPASNTKSISFKNSNTLVSAGSFSQIHWFNTTGNEIVYNGVNIHYHAPGEHSINGQFGDAEVHFVHKAAGSAPDDSQYIALGLIFKQTPAKVKSNFLAKWGPNWEGKTVDFNMNDALQDILTQGRGFYTYTGSLTTPPCSQFVRFFILDSTLDLDDTQLANLNKYFKNNQAFANGSGNNRSIQPLNGRVVSHITFDKSVLGSGITIENSSETAHASRLLPHILFVLLFWNLNSAI